MKLLYREVLGQFIPALLFAVVVLAFVLLMDRLFLLADLLVRKGVPVIVVGEIALLSLPFVISIATPLGWLIGGVITFGRMAQDNEVMVIRAAGVPSWRLFIPAFILGLCLVPVMAGFNGFILPEAQHRVRNLLTDVARKKPALRIAERAFLDDFPGYMVYIGTIDERHSTIGNVLIFQHLQGKGIPAFITAPRGEIDYTPDDQYMIITLYDGEMHELVNNRNYRRLFFHQHTINILTDDALVRRSREYRTEDEMLLYQIFARATEMKREIGKLQEQLATLSDKSAKNEVARFRQEELKTRLRYRKLEMARLLTEIQKRLSLAFSVLFFLAFGAPIGLVLRRGGIGTGFVVGLIFFAVFYILLLGGENLAESGKLTPFIGMWLPNLILILPVLELTARTFFEFSFLEFLLRIPRNLGLIKK